MAGIQDLAQHGRGNDTMIAHVTPGEMMVPPEMMARHPALQKQLYQAYLDEGMDPRQFKVGSGITSLNPTTGRPEFGFFKKLIKAAAPVVGYMVAGPVGAAIGGGLAGASDGGGWKGGLKGAAIGYVGGSLASGGAFGEGIAGASGTGFGASGWGGLGNIGGSAGNWGQTAVRRAVGGTDVYTGKALAGKNLGVGGAWKHLGKKAIGSPILMMTALGALAKEPDQPGGSTYKPNTDKGTPFKLDRPDLESGTGTHQSNAITSATAGYGTGYKDHDAVNMPYETTAYVETPVIRPAELVIGNPNITPEELMEYYRPKAYKAQGGMINHGTTGTADDVPIMASKGEFVMTADAVRNAGQGDPRMGAKKLYDLMYSLEGAR